VILTDRNSFLWTAGYVPRLDTYMGPETPNPIQVKILRGECDLETVLSDVLGLTKINFNSCLYNDRLPVTIMFADAVGDVLVSAPMDGEPKLPFKYYI
jgi:argonaute-like protein implicated in RNA metabolism and viral defense